MAFVQSLNDYLKDVKDERKILSDPWYGDALNVFNILKRAKEQKGQNEKKRALHVSETSSLSYDDDFSAHPKSAEKTLATEVLAAEVPAINGNEANTKKAKASGFFGSFFG